MKKKHYKRPTTQEREAKRRAKWLKELETLERSTSIRTVSGGLPSLGKKR